MQVSWSFAIWVIIITGSQVARLVWMCGHVRVRGLVAIYVKAEAAVADIFCSHVEVLTTTLAQDVCVCA